MRLRISVVMPVYNGERYLARALESLCAQTFGDFELVVVDDGSRDGTSDVLRRYAERLRIVCFHQTNQGASVAYNRGIAAATGDYIYMMDQDDIIHPRTMEVIDHVLSNHDVDYMVFDYCSPSDAEAVEWQRRFAEPTQLEESHILSRDALSWFVGEKRNPGIWQFAFRREILRGRSFPQGMTMEDNLFVFLLLADSALKVAHQPNTLYAYVQHEQSIMHTSALKWRLDSFDGIFRGLCRGLSEEHYRLLQEQHYAAVIKSMWRGSSFSEKIVFSRYMNKWLTAGLCNRSCYNRRWNLRFWLYGILAQLWGGAK